jgi:hypothetical protein
MWDTLIEFVPKVSGPQIGADVCGFRRPATCKSNVQKWRSKEKKFMQKRVKFDYDKNLGVAYCLPHAVAIVAGRDRTKPRKRGGLFSTTAGKFNFNQSSKKLMALGSFFDDS